MNFNKNQKIIILSMLFLVVIMLVLLVVLPDSKAERTIMMYVDGNDLESDYRMATSDIEAIDYTKIDLDKVNVLLYTGGTIRWHNFVNNDENAIYILTNSGFTKLESLDKYNMGDAKTLSDFLNYGYENYKARKYDLILYDHGAAVAGAVFDQYTDDNLSLADMASALANSPFGESNKLEAVLFRTCLNGTLEVANTFSSYAKYLIGSEEVSWGSSRSGVLGFLNNLSTRDDGLLFGQKFINIYEKDVLTYFKPYTYSVIDLSKIDKVDKYLNEYVSSIDINTNYANISRIRANSYQFGTSSDYFDTIDLYDFIEKLQPYANTSADKLLAAIKDAVVYEVHSIDSSHGLSIYFPYKADTVSINNFLNIYDKFDKLSEYNQFIKSFNSVRTGANPLNLNFTANVVTIDDPTKTISIQLTDEQLKDYAYATFTIFKRDSEHPNYYRALLNSDNVTLSEDGLLVANYENQFVKLIDEEDGSEAYIYTRYRKNETTPHQATIFIYDNDRELSDPMYQVHGSLGIINDNMKPKVANFEVSSNNERINGVIIPLDDYDVYELWHFDYRILDDNGAVVDRKKWESAPVKYGYTGTVSKLNDSLKYASLDKGDNYYALFLITDINNEVNYSKLIKVGG